MRLRFFFIICVNFLLTIAAIGVVQYAVVRRETLRLVDQEIEEMISAAYSSRHISDVEEARRAIWQALGDDRLNSVVSLYDQDGRPIYQSHSALSAGMRLNVHAGAELVETKHGHQLRVVTVPIADGKQFLQAGVVLDDVLSRWRFLGLRFGGYLLLLFLGITAISYWLSHVLVRPIKSLAGYLHFQVDRFDEPQSFEPASLVGSPLDWRSQDEVGSLVRGLRLLLGKVRDTVEINRARAALLAHELKTPLTIIRNNLEGLTPTPATADAIAEVDHLALLISGFTQWSLFCSEPDRGKTLHALRPSAVIGDVVRGLERGQPGRIDFIVDSEETLFADPEHFKTVISNLLSNALKYSRAKVEVRLAARMLAIRDYGSGFAPGVLEKVGSPFNVGDVPRQTRGTGLGLAWVSAIARHYQWQFQIHGLGDGTSVELSFPEVEAG